MSGGSGRGKPERKATDFMRKTRIVNNLIFKSGIRNYASVFPLATSRMSNRGKRAGKRKGNLTPNCCTSY